MCKGGERFQGPSRGQWFPGHLCGDGGGGMIPMPSVRVTRFKVPCVKMW